MLVAVNFGQISDHARLSVEGEIMITGSELGKGDIHPILGSFR
jgi:hypothetical protein